VFDDVRNFDVLLVAGAVVIIILRCSEPLFSPFVLGELFSSSAVECFDHFRFRFA